MDKATEQRLDADDFFDFSKPQPTLTPETSEPTTEEQYPDYVDKDGVLMTYNDIAEDYVPASRVIRPTHAPQSTANLTLPAANPRSRRAAFRFTDEQVRTILHLSSLGYTDAEIAAYMRSNGGAPTVNSSNIHQRIKQGLLKTKPKRAISLEEAEGWKRE